MYMRPFGPSKGIDVDEAPVRRSILSTVSPERRVFGTPAARARSIRYVCAATASGGRFVA
jgi:hypothetical protein